MRSNREETGSVYLCVHAHTQGDSDSKQILHIPAETLFLCTTLECDHSPPAKNKMFPDEALKFHDATLGVIIMCCS